MTAHVPKKEKPAPAPKGTPSASAPLVSIIIPCYNAQSTLRECLESIVSQDYPRFEVIVVNDGSTDSTSEIIRAFPSVRALDQPNKGASAARNAGMKKAKGDILLIQDSDAKVFPGWIAAHVHAQRNGKKVVGGSVIPWNDNFVGMCDHYSTWYEYYPQKPAQGDRYQISSTNLSFAREVVEKVGLFDTTLPRLEDVDYCRRIHAAGYFIAFAPEIIMGHHDRSTWTSYLRHHYKYGESAPWVRTRESGTRFAWLIPRSPLGALLMILPLAVLHTGFVVRHWLPARPKVVLYLPFIFISKLAHAVGVYDGVKAKNKETKTKK